MGLTKELLTGKQWSGQAQNIEHVSYVCMYVRECVSYILKAKKFAEPPFQSKNIA